MGSPIAAAATITAAGQIRSASDGRAAIRRPMGTDPAANRNVYTAPG